MGAPLPEATDAHNETTACCTTWRTRALFLTMQTGAAFKGALPPRLSNVVGESQPADYVVSLPEHSKREAIHRQQTCSNILFKSFKHDALIAFLL